MQKKVIKTDFALLDDAKKIATEFAVVLKEIESNGSEFSKYAMAIEMLGEEGLRLFDKARITTDKIEAAYKALGANPSVSNEYKSLLKSMDTLLTYRKRYSF